MTQNDAVLCNVCVMASRRSNDEGTIYQLPDGRWQARTPRRAGDKVRTKTTAKRGDAAAWLKDQLLAERVAERHPELVAEPAPSVRGQTVAELLGEYLERHVIGEDRKGNRQTTQESKRSDVARANRYLGSILVAELDADAYEAAEDRMVADGLGWSSIKGVRTVVGQAWRKRRVRRPNPIAELERPALAPATKFDKRALTADERRRLVDAMAEHRLRVAVILQAYLGLRPGEVLGLCWDVIDLDGDEPTLSVVRQVVTERNRPTLVEHVKTKSSLRTLVLPPRIAGELRVLREIARRSGEAAPLVFPARGGAPTGQRNYGDQLERVLADADLPRITPHELRHTCNELMRESKVSAEDRADILGHDDKDLVQTDYRHRGTLVRASTVLPDMD